MFPYSCDALLFHLPIATGVLIAINIVTFAGAMLERIDVTNGWLLEYGSGLHPIEWALSPFMHGSIEHLLGNMFFLWSFGLITEGKLGWWRFLLVYLGIAIGQSAIEQAVMPHFAPDVPFTLGASSAIYGLMAMACVWAPVNELSIFMIFFLRPMTFEMAVGIFASIYVGLDLLYCLLLGVGAMGSIAHLMGGAIGLIVGIVLLKVGAVECQDWDLFSVLSGEYGTEKQRNREVRRDAAQSSPEATAARVSQQTLEARRKFDAYLQIGQPEQALAVRRRMADKGMPLELVRNDFVRLIVGLHKQQRWAESAPLMADMLTLFPDESPTIRLKLAQICVMELDKPNRALELLAAWDGATLAEPHESLRRKIAAKARRMLADGEVEVDDGAW